MAIQITNVGLNMYRSASAGNATPLVSYVALGTSNITPTAADTRLGNEVFRKAVSSYVDGTTGIEYISLYIAPSDAVGVNIAEIAFYGGGTASLAPNSGTMLARGLYSHPSKTNLESIQAQLALTFTAV